MIWINFEKCDMITIEDENTPDVFLVVLIDGEEHTVYDPDAIEAAKKWIGEKNNPKQNTIGVGLSSMLPPELKTKHDEFMRNQTAGEMAG